MPAADRCALSVLLGDTAHALLAAAGWTLRTGERRPPRREYPYVQ